jgi:uncharacterized protein
VRSTNEIAVFIPASLEDDTVEDVAFTTFRAWHLGVKGKDNGVLLVIAPVERKAWITTGKGIEGDLTDLQSNDIIRQKIRPALAPGHEDYRAAVETATDAMIAELDKAGTTSARKPAPVSGGSVLIGLIFMAIVFLVPIILFITIIRALTRAFTSQGPGARRGWVSGSTWSNDSSWSSGSTYDSGWSGGGSDFSSGGGDSGFSGGGGDTGGGGAGDSF